MEKKFFVNLLVKGSLFPLAENVQTEIDGNILTVNGKKFSLVKNGQLALMGRVSIVYKKGTIMVGRSVPFYA